MKRPFGLFAGFIALFFGGVFALAYSVPPESAYLRIQRNAADNEWGKVYRWLSNDTKSEFESLQTHVIAHARALGIDQSKVLTPKEAFIRIMPKNALLRSTFVVENPMVVAKHEESDGVVLSVIGGKDSKPRRIRMVREGAIWRMDVDLE